MTLDWNTSKVKYFNDNPDELWVTYRKGTTEEHEDVNAETKSLIFGTMSVGIGDLKYKNAPDFYARWKIMEHYDRLYLYSEFENSELKYTYLTPSVLIKHLGLSTNVGYVSRTEWIRRYVKSHANDRYIEIKPNLKDITKMYNEFLKEFEQTL